MKKISTLFAALITVCLMYSCEESSGTETPRDAVRMTEAQVMDSPKFGYWYNKFKKDYEITDSVKALIDADFNPDIHRFVVMITPCEACNSSQYDAARFVKVLNEGGIDETYYEIYSMPDGTETIHPYEDQIESLNELPGMYVLKDNQVIYSVNDTLNSTKLNLESIVIDALRK